MKAFRSRPPAPAISVNSSGCRWEGGGPGFAAASLRTAGVPAHSSGSPPVDCRRKIILWERGLRGLALGEFASRQLPLPGRVSRGRWPGCGLLWNREVYSSWSRSVALTSEIDNDKRVKLRGLAPRHFGCGAGAKVPLCGELCSPVWGTAAHYLFLPAASIPCAGILKASWLRA